MKNYDSRTYSINDFVEWDKANALELNPFFQRRPVWKDKAKSYLMDTILRGKPIPKVFIRQKINVTTKTSIREIVDGQQRMRTILSFIKDGFMVTRRQNPDHGGKLFSQFPEDVQAQVLAYEISVDLLINLPDSEILDIFSRLNSYAVILNEQEKLNATYFGSFKIFADALGRKYTAYWTSQGILSKQQVLRMQEVSLCADLLIALKDGIKSKKQIKRYYDIYEETYDEDVGPIEVNFDLVIATIARIYPEGLSGTEFSRVHQFYSLFTAVAHSHFGLKGLENTVRPPLVTVAEIERARNGLDRVGLIYATEDVGTLTPADRTFLQDSRRATTDATVRERRAKFLLGLIAG